MISSLKSIFSYFVFVGVVIVLIAIILFLTTKKYNKKKIRLLALFSSLNSRSIILISSFVLNLTLCVFYAFAPHLYCSFVIYFLVINTIISMIVSLDLKIIIGNSIYTIISIFSLKIISLVYNYLSLIYYDRLTFILGLIFTIMVCIYEFFIMFRLTEIVLKNKKFVGGLKNGKSRKK